jgi:hypothetical protein
MPLQLFFADLHSDVPLQEFTPVQCMVAASAANVTLGNAEVNNIAAAAASAALDTLLICMIDSLICFRTQRYCCFPYKDLANTGIITQLSKLMLCSTG